MTSRFENTRSAKARAASPFSAPPAAAARAAAAWASTQTRFAHNIDRRLREASASAAAEAQTFARAGECLAEVSRARSPVLWRKHAIPRAAAPKAKQPYESSQATLTASRRTHSLAARAAARELRNALSVRLLRWRERMRC
jgi:hypothetical protein